MAKREYASAEYYERKLARVMDRFGVESYDYNFDRHGCWIQFRFEGELYRFEHSVEKARMQAQYDRVIDVAVRAALEREGGAA